MTSKSTRELFDTCYGGVYQRYRMHGAEMPEVHYVDNPRVVQMALGGGEEAIVPSLSDGSKYRSKNYLRYDKSIMVCYEPKSSLALAGALRSTLASGASSETPAVGIDIEWEYIPAAQRSAGDSDSTQRPTAIGFATEELVVIVHMASMDDLPAPFIDILTDQNVMKVGHSIGGDCARIKRYFDVVTSPTTCVMQEAKSKIPEPETGSWALADICDSVLGKRMRKDEILRCSFVADQERLQTDQQQYLAVDCVVPLLLHKEFVKVPNTPVAMAAAQAAATIASGDTGDGNSA